MLLPTCSPNGQVLCVVKYRSGRRNSITRITGLAYARPVRWSGVYQTHRGRHGGLPYIAAERKALASGLVRCKARSHLHHARPDSSFLLSSPSREIPGMSDAATALIPGEQDCQLERAGTADHSRDPCHRRMTVVSVPGRPQTSVSTASNVESLVKRPVKLASLN